MGTSTPAPIKVSASTKEKIRLAAAVTGRSQADLVAAAVDEYLTSHGQEMSRGIRHARSTLVPKRSASASLALLKQRRDEILVIAERHGARDVRVFGSAARGDRVSRDVDLLVEFDEGRSLLDHVALVRDLEDLLGIPVDVVEPSGLHRAIRESVLSEAVAL